MELEKTQKYFHGSSNIEYISALCFFGFYVLSFPRLCLSQTLTPLASAPVCFHSFFHSHWTIATASSGTKGLSTSTPARPDMKSSDVSITSRLRSGWPMRLCGDSPGLPLPNCLLWVQRLMRVWMQTQSCLGGVHMTADVSSHALSLLGSCTWVPFSTVFAWFT